MAFKFNFSSSCCFHVIFWIWKTWTWFQKSKYLKKSKVLFPFLSLWYHPSTSYRSSHCSLCCYHLVTIPCPASSYYTCNNQQSLPHSFSQPALWHILSALSESITFTHYSSSLALYTLVLASLPDDDGGGWSISIASWNFPSSFPLHIHISKQYIFSSPSSP